MIGKASASYLGDRSALIAILGFASAAVLGSIALALSSALVIQLSVLTGLGFMLSMVVFGIQRMAGACLLAAFAFMPLNATRATDWLTYGDITLVLAIILGALGYGWTLRRISLPAGYLGGCALLILAGLISSFLASDLQSLLNLTRLVIAAMALPFLGSLWRPSLPWVQVLAVCYLLGQSASVLYGLFTPINAYNGRGQGLTLHPKPLRPLQQL